MLHSTLENVFKLFIFTENKWYAIVYFGYQLVVPNKLVLDFGTALAVALPLDPRTLSLFARLLMSNICFHNMC